MVEFVVERVAMGAVVMTIVMVGVMIALMVAGSVVVTITAGGAVMILVVVLEVVMADNPRWCRTLRQNWIRWYSRFELLSQGLESCDTTSIVTPFPSLPWSTKMHV